MIFSKKRLLNLIFIFSILFSNNACTAWPAISAILGLMGGGKGGSAALLIPPGGGGSEAGATESSGSGASAGGSGPSGFSFTGVPGSFVINAPITDITPSFSGTIESCTVSPSLPAGLTLNSSTCVVSGTPTVATAYTEYTITATNSTGSSTATLSFAVVNVAPSAASITNPGAPFVQGTAITNISPSVTGTVTGCSSSPSLPAGLTMGLPNCIISGIPTATASSQSYTITFTNAAGSTTANVTFAVNPALVTDLAISSSGPLTYVKDTAITPVTFSFTGVVTNCIVSPSLPAGLSINTSNCTISGTPTVYAASQTYTITASNATGNSNTQTLTFSITGRPTIAIAGSPFTFTQNVGISTITPTLGGGSLTSCTASPLLPTGLSINSTTCAITGTPTVYNLTPNDYTITAANTYGSTNATISITINPEAPSNLALVGSGPFVLNQSVAMTPITFTKDGLVTGCVSTPGLPAGLSINSVTCEISGTPTIVSGATSYSIQATNGTGSSNSVSVSIQVIAPAPSSLSFGTYPSEFTQNFAIATIIPTYSGTVTGCSSSPALPTGLSLSSTCVLSGTPTSTSSSTSYTITATNGVQTTDTTIAFAVVAAPTVQFQSATSNSTNEATGNRSITLTLSVASKQVVTVLVREVTGGTATAGSDHTSVGTALNVSFSVGETSKTFNQAVIDDAIYESGNETINLEIYSPTYATLGSQTTHTFTIIDDEIGILSAWTLDCDGNGKIDHYEVTFSRSVQDSTFPGYASNSLGEATSDWFISGRGNTRLHHGSAFNTSCLGRTDNPNDTVLYLAFDEGGSFDTGAKPDFTTTSTPSLTDGASYTMSQVFTASVTEADRAKPVVVSASSSAGNSTLTVVFSEDVYTTTGAPACGAGGNLDTSDFIYNNASGSGVTSIASMGSDTCGVTDRTVTLTMDTTFVAGDAVDSISGSLTLYDAADNSGSATARLISISSSNPIISSIEQYDVNKNGKIDQLKITFNQAMTDSSIANADAARFTIGGVAATKVDSITDNPSGGTIVSPNNDPGLADDSIVTIFLDDITLAGTELKSMSFTQDLSKWLSGTFPLLTVANLSTVISDKAPPVILNAVATAANGDPGIQSTDYLVVTFSEPTDKSITTGNISSRLTLSSSHIWGGVTSVNWNTAGDVMTVVFSGSGSTIATGDTITIASGVRDTSASANESFNIPSVNPISGSFGIDTTPPYLLYASDITESTLMVQFSEPMFAISNIANCGTDPDRTKAYNCVANYTLTEDPANGCTDVVVSSLTVLSTSAVRLTLNAGTPFCNIKYRISVATSVSDSAVTPNAMGSPNFLTFIGLEPIRVVVAAALTSNTFRISFNKPALGGLNATDSAECNTSTECGLRYKISPQIGDGTVTSAILSGDQSSVTLTHNGIQAGVAYTVIAANARDNDGFTNGSVKIAGVTGGLNSMQAAPSDRATFIGSGTACDTLVCGSFFDDPFQDGSTFSFAFEYDKKVYLGTNDKNDGAFRFEPSGANSILVTFSFLQNASQSLSCIAATGFGFISSGFTSSCGTNSGPNGEVGSASFSSINLTVGGTAYELLLAGVLKDNINTVYYTQDKDTVLDMKSFGVTGTNGNNSKSTIELYGIEDKVFTGLASQHGTFAPIGNRMPATVSSGIITIGSPEDLAFRLWPHIGKAGSTANPNSSGVVSIDFIRLIGSSVYIANNGGVLRVSKANFINGASPANTGKVTDNFAPTLVTPTSADFTGTSLYWPNSNATTGGGLGKVRPGEKAYPFIIQFQGDLYLARNVATGANSTNLRGELWKCTPDGTGSCSAASWTRVISGMESELGGIIPTHKAISALTTNGSNTLYIGFDGNSTNGAQVFRYRSSSGSKPNATTSSQSLVTNGGWVKQGTFGLGSGSDYIISSVSVYDSAVGRYYLYVIIGDGLLNSSIKVSRQYDIN